MYSFRSCTCEDGKQLPEVEVNILKHKPLPRIPKAQDVVDN
jgi:hypothetical protein